MFTVDWTQHAVGHGGFHTGRACVGDGVEFNWIFDCGAQKTAAFDTFLKTWTAQNQQPIDWLFVSHFDTDHVSGLDTLMSRAVVRDVMVPYVNQRELAFQLLHEIDRGHLDRSLFELAADPAAFFLGRGAERVTFLRGRGPDEEPGTEEGSRLPGGSPDDGSWLLKMDPPPQRMREPPKYAAVVGEPSRVQQVFGGTCEMTAMRGPGRLRLVPHTAPISPHVHRRLLRELQALVGRIPWLAGRPGLGDLAFAIGHFARTASGRASLRSLFRTHAGSSNRSSLSLLSITEVESHDRASSDVRVGSHWYWNWAQEQGPAGWLNTGDAELCSTIDLNAWTAVYGPDADHIRVLALPHHGSDKNSDQRLQAFCANALLAAHVKAGSKKHPGANVTLWAGSRLACVTDQSGTDVRMHFWHN